MTVYTCEDSLEGILTCIYDAWASRLGQKNIRLMLEPVTQPELFCDYLYIPPDSEKSSKVAHSIRNRISLNAWEMVYRVSRSCDPAKADRIYRFLLYGFAYGSRSEQMLGVPAVMNFLELNRKVLNEVHHHIEFIRFSVCPGNILVSHISPRSDILTLTAPHFSDRMPSESWMIIDDVRSTAAVHPGEEICYYTVLSFEELETLKSSQNTDSFYSGLWKVFFQSVTIRERENPDCQRSFLPLWLRRHMTEFQ